MEKTQETPREQVERTLGDSGIYCVNTGYVIHRRGLDYSEKDRLGQIENDGKVFVDYSPTNTKKQVLTRLNLLTYLRETGIEVHFRNESALNHFESSSLKALKILLSVI